MTELTRAKLLILIVLRTGNMHGYAIMLAIEQIADGDFEVGAGTLYRSLAEMVRDGLVVIASETPRYTALSKKIYAIKPAGREAVAAELARLKKLIEHVEALS